MTHRFSGLAFLTIAALVCSAHIGSPDAWYEGRAGPYHVLVHVRAPPVVPGIAVVNVNPVGRDVERVTAFVNKHDATGGAPPPDVAAPDRNNPGWYRTQLWIMTAGSHGVTVTLTGRQGIGSVVVPLTAVAGRRLDFDTRLAGLLGAVGLFLTLGIVTLVGAAVRESVLPPGVEPDAGRRRRARYAQARALIVIALVMTGMATWWRAADANFARALFQPLTVSTRIELAPQPRLTLAIDDSAWVHRDDVGWLRAHGKAEVSGVVEDHGHLVHLFLVAEDARSAFAHLHPRTSDTVSFTTPLPPLPPGNYRAFADIVHASGFAQTLTSTVTVPPEVRAAEPSPGNLDDSWGVGRDDGYAKAMVLQDGTTLTWLRGAKPLVTGADADLRFSITRPAGDTAALEPYLGMAGHAIVVREDGEVFIHLHPLGTISVAAQAMLTARPPHLSHDMSRPILHFPYAFPAPGTYTVWVQFKRSGRVLTGSFAADVAGRR